MERKKPIVLCVLDGWGYRAEKKDNAIEMGNTPVWHQLIKEYPTITLQTSGLDVGLPAGQMGNSEVGHMNLGAGRVVMQDLPRIDQAIETGTLKENPVLQNLIKKLQQTKGTCHIMGLLSPGGVHAHQNHMLGLARILDEAGIPVAVHAFTDGRDTPTEAGLGYLETFQNQIADLHQVKIRTISGRFYAMDRDNRWERITQAYNTLVNADGVHYDSVQQAMTTSYSQNVTDEFVVPCCIDGYDGMHDGDAFIMANFRLDRSREITQILGNPDFDKASRSRVVQFCAKVGMTEYSVDHKKFLDILFPPEDLTHILGQEVADAGMTQLRIAETEKYAHVTFYFNAGQEALFKGEERILIPSPKVATYDLKPEMSAIEVCDKLVEAIKSKRFDLIVCNFANPDMVGHTGVLAAAIKAVETVDTCVGRIVEALKEVDGCVFITADHGNAELMKDQVTGAPYTAHTNTPVKAVLVNAPKEVKGLSDGRLSDVAPTLLQLLGLPQPPEMTGHSLLIL